MDEISALRPYDLFFQELIYQLLDLKELNTTEKSYTNV